VAGETLGEIADFDHRSGWFSGEKVICGFCAAGCSSYLSAVRPGPSGKLVIL
jgi:hypothetical protein